MRDFVKASEFLGKKTSRPLENHTRIERRAENSIAIKYHDTDIVTYFPDGRIIVNTGGWKTKTTKDRINRYTSFQIGQYNDIWYFYNNGKKYLFIDSGMINADGTTDFPLYTKVYEKNKQNELKRIRQYCKDYINALVNNSLDMPSSGDCWFCAIHDTKTNKSLGEHHLSDHINLHIEEKYYVPSLLINAISRYDVSIMAKYIIQECFNHTYKGNCDSLHSYIYKSLYKYVKDEIQE
jgi:hypothetical protein